MKMMRLLSGLPPVLTISPALAQNVPDRDPFWDYGWGWSGMMVGGGLIMIVFWGGVLLVVLVTRGAGGIGPNESVRQSRPAALDILQERYARGEIDKQEIRGTAEDADRAVTMVVRTAAQPAGGDQP